MKVLILQQFLPHYRIPIFNALGNTAGIELTVAHSEGEVKPNPGGSFQQVLLHWEHRFGFFWVKDDLLQLCNKFDVVICLFNLKVPAYWRLSLIKKRKFRFIFWGIGVTAIKGYDIANPYDRARYWLAKKADAVVFYSSYPIEKYVAGGVPREKMFVAHNTVQITPEFLSGDMEAKNALLFLGTLYADKRVDELVEAFLLAIPKFNRPVLLDIVGDGDQRQALELQVQRAGLQGKVLFHGAINDAERQKVFFRKSFACISPGQAGLSVLQSLSFGVPFVTTTNAITGGERLNVKHGYNGVLYQGDAEKLADELVKIVNEESYCRTLSENAYHYFETECTVAKMIKGYTDAIAYATRTK
jgi:glycosyltransferase involved in cell wall biosynthesis